MAAPRLPFLWPMLAKGFDSSNPAARSARAAVRIRAYHPTSQRRRPAGPAPQQPRYGTANEPPPHLGGGKGLGPPTKQDQPEEEKKALPKIDGKLQQAGEVEVKNQKEAQKTKQKDVSTVDGGLSSQIHGDPMRDAGSSHPTEKPPGIPDAPPDKPLESILQTVPDPSKHAEEQSSSSFQQSAEEEHPDRTFDEHTPSDKAPHIDTPRYVHHFDTYGLVRRLVDSGWSEEQAITTMKAVRLQLAQNMDLAREALVSKSQVENETYLFRAACAELKTEVTARRKAELEKMRTERDQLQHEVEILTQRLGQESAALKDELKGMFDDRKMAVRNEQLSVEAKLQRLNYQITVDLQADAKSEVEGLRWVLTRRTIAALFAVVIMVVGSLKIFSDAAHEEEMNRKRKANMKSGSTQTDSSGESGPSEFVGERQVHGGGSQLNGGEMVVDSLPTG
ncbi:uncharacterized protein MYCFIDRAFT_150638 [Pseudocercospora fijiensis CIRAD86]|uniref:DUF1640 domain-containing protein n=1 Tax=Pseudocercospora fijiensis (strain CIRAD86) TaxID=383855 RepID=M3B8E2_PSEFD|nr:uncharacterized protein MYCFIDRAFT_150638 [Pseudocercospora fijiensis CIRAD86]EME85583.1 hypothetical protein MYCFIDRAFT_150638 [Pseudocercospora fijiensis CIRAD86]